jgi:hypothetical protein
MSADG